MLEDRSGENGVQNADGLLAVGKGGVQDAGTHETPRPLPQGGMPSSTMSYLCVPEERGAIPSNGNRHNSIFSAEALYSARLLAPYFPWAQ